MPRPSTPVLELGCGLGLVGIAAAWLGWQTESTDYVEDALVIASHNAHLNGVAAHHRVGYLDWANPVGQPRACVVGSDLAYEKKNHPLLARTVGELLLPGGMFLLSDPQRPATTSLVDLLTGQGYRHQHDTVVQPWRDVDHRVDLHRFERPVGGAGR